MLFNLDGRQITAERLPDGTLRVLSDEQKEKMRTAGAEARRQIARKRGSSPSTDAPDLFAAGV